MNLNIYLLLKEVSYKTSQFARAINDKWAAEIWVGGTFSNTPYEEKVLKTNI